MRLSETKKEILSQIEMSGGYSWVTAGKEIENYVPNCVWEKVAGKSLLIDDEYSDVPAILANSMSHSTKIELAHKAEDFIDVDMINGHLDLWSRVEQLCTHVRRWNSIVD